MSNKNKSFIVGNITKEQNIELLAWLDRNLIPVSNFHVFEGPNDKRAVVLDFSTIHEASKTLEYIINNFKMEVYR